MNRTSMTISAAFALALAAATLASCAPPEELDSGEVEQSSSSILDGIKVSTSSYPAIGRVLSDLGTPNASAGTGVLIGPRHVLTAAHVVKRNHLTPANLVFRRYPSAGTKKDYAIKSVRIHPSYLWTMGDTYRQQIWLAEGTPFEYDVAVIELTTAVVGVTPIKFSTSEPRVGELVTFFGFGEVATGGKPPVQPPDGTLHRGTNKIASLTEADLNIVYNQGTSSVYRGDSGGPLVYNSYLAGVVRRGNGYVYGSTASFARGSRFRAWALDVVAGKELAPDAYEPHDTRSTSPNRYFTRGAVLLDPQGLRHWGEGRSFHVTDDEDGLAFRLTSTHTVTFALDRPVPSTYNSPQIRLYKDGVEHPVDLQDSGSEGSEHYLTFIASLPAGTYDVVMRGSHGPLAWYTAGVSIDGWVSHADPWDPAWRNGVLSAPSLDESGYRLDRSVSWQSEDLAYLTITARRPILIETLPMDGNPNSFDTVLVLYDIWHREITRNDDRPDLPGLFSALDLTLEPDRYLVGVQGYDGRPVHGYSVRARAH